MRPFYLLLSILLLFHFHGSAQYSTPGTGISWNLLELSEQAGSAVTFSDDVYWINEELTISATDTLYIFENSIVKINAGVLISVAGVLQVNVADSVLFTAQDSLQNYQGFRFEDSDASYCIHSIVDYGGGLDLVDSDVHFNACVFGNNDNSNSTGLIDLFHSSPSIGFCTFINNQGPAILSGANSECSPFIYHNQILANNAANTNMPQINLGTSAPDSSIVIRGNTIEGMYDNAGGIAVSTLAGGSISCVIDSNEITNNRYGITVYGFDIESVISNNVIADNNIENLPMQGGSGINFWGGTSNSSRVFGNTIYGNLWGITITGDALPNLGQIDPDTVNIGQNSIFDNGNLGTEYDLYNNTPNPISAENNYWGSYDLDSVELVIFHYPDDESLGFVDYLPIMDSTTTVGVEKRFTSREYLAYPNPTSDFVFVKTPENSTPMQLEIYNDEGEKILSKQCSTNPETLDFTAFPSGIYFLRFVGAGFNADKKIIRR